MSETLHKYDGWLQDSGPAALVLREHLQSVDGPDGVLFPATFAKSEDGTFKGGYNIDVFSDGTNVCLVDSVGSQANRLEPIFMQPGYVDLVPQVVIVAGERKVNLLEPGHRAGDAIARCSALQANLHEAFLAAGRGDMEPMAKIAPTSLVFGAWDSRATQVKLPRLIASTIRAFNVKKLTRSAQYIPPLDYIEAELLEEPSDKQTKDSYAERGFIHVPASGTHGGVIATGGVRRDAVLHLAAVRLLTAATQERTLPLRRYVLGLALTALTYRASTYLRQGCNLVIDPQRQREFYAIDPDGSRQEVSLTHAEALEYARGAAKAFGVGPSLEVNFDRDKAREDVTEGATGGKRKRKAKAVPGN